MKTLFSVDDCGDVADFFYGDKLIAKLDRKAVIDGVENQTQTHHIVDVDGFDEFLKLKGYFEEVKHAKWVVRHNIVCKRTLLNCTHMSCLCKDCDSGLENEEKCTSCDYYNCCDKE